MSNQPKTPKQPIEKSMRQDLINEQASLSMEYFKLTERRKQAKERLIQIDAQLSLLESTTYKENCE